MNPAFVAAVIDSLLPGDEILPSGSRAGLPPGVADVHGRVLGAIAKQAGDAEAFVRMDETARAMVLREVERTMNEAFRACLIALYSVYYELDSVLTAIGWRVDPPQPRGHAVDSLDDATRDRLNRVAQRGPLWRS